MKVRSLAFFLAAAVIIAIDSTAWAQTPSCITASVMSTGAIVGIVSYSPLVIEPNGCIDGAHSIGESYGINSSAGNVEETLFHDTATITSVSISIDYENNCSVVSVNPTVSGSGMGQFSDFNGTNAGHILFLGSSDHVLPYLVAPAQTSI